MGYQQCRGFYEPHEIPTVNLIQLLYENTAPEDFVVVEMDIEGAEWDILPCLAASPAAGLIDELLVEVHPSTWSLTSPSDEEFDDAIAQLRKVGVRIPAYFTDVR